ncbi:hypothetical protein [Methylococcus sp. EFPC2]|uniref:hypothetical protein n=1 Tax=Methylococcus sp. EFPC2 TaxID=2812648 RepID=UPI0019678596|nr:hypothetical protein [Methylococcus sp. EFPC2]QSA97558.1 hypothetical protein JWZ97_01545 [Methylococcus sp. EFPC2]
MTQRLEPLALLTCAALLSACASAPHPAPPKEAAKPRSGEQILIESQGLQQIGERWLEGQRKVQQGEELIRQGQQKIDEGERIVEEGRKIMKESEEGYQTIKK